jgi:hypothetical protein
MDIMVRGYAFPFINDVGARLSAKYDIFSITGLRFADAFNYAYYSKLGIFTDKNLKFMKSGVHGSTNYTNMIYNKDLPRNTAKTNIYYIKDILKLPEKISHHRKIKTF